MLGEAEFNEVFLDGAYVPDDLVVGDVDGGWKVTMGTLAFERAAIATGRVNITRLLDDLLEHVRAHAGADPLVRHQVAELYGRGALQQLTAKRILSGIAARGVPGPEASTAKLFASPLVEDIADFAISLSGVAGQELGGDADRWLRLAYQARGTSIAGGTTFIQRNIVAERVLGLPRGK
jgi:alkylation response protein AidB-like acyl-CoA dehydrogenase